MKTTSDSNNLVNPNTGRISITEAFGETLAVLLSNKIQAVYPSFPSQDFCAQIKAEVVGQRYTQRVETIATHLKRALPEKYTDALAILMKILGPENPHETGMFTHYYWLLPVGKFIELYGLDHYNPSIQAIEELTKRNTGEYAIRPFARKYPESVLTTCHKWASSSNFHLRRLASEGLRPKLPWATKLDLWHDHPSPIFKILEILKEDEVKFVKKSVANHLRDWLKVNPSEANRIINRWAKSQNKHTQWILKHAQR